MRTSVIVCLGTLAVLLVTSSSFAGHGCKSCGQRAHGHRDHGIWGISTCANCDDAPVVRGAPGASCGSCATGGGTTCGSCQRGGLLCHMDRYVVQSWHCTGCGDKYTPEWHNRYCEPCNRLGNWTGPSLHYGRPYVGQPRSGSNIGSPVLVEPPTIVVPPAKLPSNAPALPETSVKRAKRASYTLPSRMPRHRRAPAPTVRTVRVP